MRQDRNASMATSADVVLLHSGSHPRWCKEAKRSIRPAACLLTAGANDDYSALSDFSAVDATIAGSWHLSQRARRRRELPVIDVAVAREAIAPMAKESLSGSVVWSGPLVQEARPGLFLDACAHHLQHRQCLLVGDGPLRAPLLRAAKRMGATNVHVVTAPSANNNDCLVLVSTSVALGLDSGYLNATVCLDMFNRTMALRTSQHYYSRILPSVLHRH